MKYPWQWNIADLNNLIGQPEALRLEFKSARLLNLKQKGNDINKVVAALSKEVSAFANTEGGTLIIGIEEDNDSKPRVASQISGVNIESWHPEKLQQIIDSNISPPLPGIRVKPIYLDTEHLTCVFIIYVPAGTTAYQAKDHIYYGRSEYESKALPDHEIRMRMFRGKVSSAKISIANLRVDEKPVDARNNHFIESYDLIRLDKGVKPKIGRKYSFDVSLANIGEININSFKVELRFSFSTSLNDHAFDKYLEDGEFSFKDGWQEQKGLFTLHQLLDETERNFPEEKPKMKVNIYPDDAFYIQQYSFGLNKGVELAEHDLTLSWKLYLENRPPLQGEIPITEASFTT